MRQHQQRLRWRTPCLAAALGLAMAGSGGAIEVEDAGPLMVGPNEVGGVLCSARNADDADQLISIVATDETGGMVGAAAAANVVPGAERQLVLPFGAVSQRSITCRSEGEAAISSSISVKERTGRVVEALEGSNPL